jgi:hypothetical protein
VFLHLQGFCVLHDLLLTQKHRTGRNPLENTVLHNVLEIPLTHRREHRRRERTWLPNSRSCTPSQTPTTTPNPTSNPGNPAPNTSQTSSNFNSSMALEAPVSVLPPAIVNLNTNAVSTPSSVIPAVDPTTITAPGSSVPGTPNTPAATRLGCGRGGYVGVGSGGGRCCSGRFESRGGRGRF